MRYLIISDIHGSLPRLQRALDFYRQQQCDMLLILGDILNYGPRNSIPEGIDAKGIVAALNPLADDIVAVRGNCDAEVDQMLLRFPMMSDYVLLVDEGRRILLTHGHVYNPDHLPTGHYDAVFSATPISGNSSTMPTACSSATRVPSPSPRAAMSPPWP